MTEHYDVVIVGTGAGGGTLAHVLASSGQRILLLERGDFLPREMANWDPGQVFAEGKYISPDTWYDSDGQPFQPQVHYFVGGATKMYGAALYRLRPGDFGEIKHYPWPAVSHEPRIQQLADVLADRGYRPFHAPCGILLNEADRPASTCIRCAWCDGYPCLVHAKCDAETIAVRPVLDRPNVTLLVGAEVTALRTDPAGRTVTGLEVSRYGKKETYRGDIVVVAAGAANSARLLLRSASDAHPDGLANSRARWAATTCSTTARPWWHWTKSPTTRCSRRPSA